MRPTFALDLDLKPISVNAPVTQPHTFRVGDVFFLVKDYQYEYGPVPTGTKLFVQQIEQDDGTMWLRAEGDVPALFFSDNLLAAVPYDCEDLLPCLRAAIRCPAAALVPNLDGEGNPLPASNVRHLVIKCVATVALLVGLLASSEAGITAIDLKPATQSGDPVELIHATVVKLGGSTG